MKSCYPILLAVLLAFSSPLAAQFVNVYDTGYGTSDGWSGWTVTSSGSTYQNVNGVNLYSFTLGTVGDPFSIEMSRQFTITGTPINIAYILYAQDAVVEIFYSTDNTNWTLVQSNTFGSTYGSSSYLTTYTPLVSTYYLKIKLAGTIGSMQNATFDSFTVDASTTNTTGLSSGEKAATQIFLSQNVLNIKSADADFSVSIYDLTGRQVLSFTNEKTRDLSFLSNGIYFVAYSTGGQNRMTKKIIVNK